MDTRAASAAPARRDHAVVIGGSLAGLWTARVLADHYARVTVIERDHFPDGPERRRGVPQARHIHILLLRGQREAERLFPGLDADLAAAGAPSLDWAAECAYRFSAGWGQRFQSDIVTRTCSRDLLEYTIRRRLAALDNVTFRQGCEATGLLTDAAGRGVAGIRIRPAGIALGEEIEEELPADLVADASGRNTRAPRWLAALGYDAPAETVIDAGLGYASRWYETPPGRRDWQSVIIAAQPPHNRRGGGIYPVEGGRWIVTLAGTNRDHPPTDEAGFLDFAGTLASPVLREALADAAPLSPVWGYRSTENRLRHYERLPRWPERFVALGDAVCAFNPVYGQGMTASLLGALTLGRLLRETRATADPADLARRFQRQLARTNETPWLLATGEDFRWPGTVGGRPGPATRLTHRYLDRLGLLLPEHPAIERTFLEVAHLVTPPSALFRPSILFPVLAHSLRPRRGHSASSAPAVPELSPHH